MNYYEFGLHYKENGVVEDTSVFVSSERELTAEDAQDYFYDNVNYDGDYKSAAIRILRTTKDFFEKSTEETRVYL